MRPIGVMAVLIAAASVMSASALSACGSRQSGAVATGVLAASASPAPASFVGMWKNADGQVLFVDRAASGYVGTFYDGGVKALQADLHERADALVGSGKPVDRWKIAYDTSQGRLVLSDPKWASMSFTKAPPDAAGLSGGTAAQTDPFVGTWLTLGQTDASRGFAVIAKTPDGYRVSEGGGGGLFGTYAFVRNGDTIQGVPPDPKPKDTIRWVFGFEGHPGQLVMKVGNGLPHLLVRTSMSTTVPTRSPTP